MEGRLDWERRFDHMQQHTGQHVLSRAFVEIAKADTRSFHLGDLVVTIDVDLPEPEPALLRRVEDLANRVVWEDRPVVTHVVSLEKARAFPLRKPPDVEGDVRVVEVEGFDWSACGGPTWRGRRGRDDRDRGNRALQGGTRVSFVCGGRALRRLREATDLLRGLCLEFTSGEEDLPRAITRLKSEQSGSRRLKPLLAESIAREAESLLAEAERGSAGPVVARYFPERSPEEVSALAGQVAARGGIALFAAGVAGAAGAAARRAGRDRAAHFSAPKVQYRSGDPRRLCRPMSERGRTPGGSAGAIPADRAAEAIEAARGPRWPERTRQE